MPTAASPVPSTMLGTSQVLHDHLLTGGAVAELETVSDALSVEFMQDRQCREETHGQREDLAPELHGLAKKKHVPPSVFAL